MLAKLRLYGWGAAMGFRLGKPDHALGFLGGIGDDLLCTAPIHELLQRGARRVWFFTRHPELYRFDSRVKCVPEDPRLMRLATRFGKPMRPLSYSQYDPATDRDTALEEHCVASMCRRAGIAGRIALRPHLPLATAELAMAARWRNYVVVQSSSLHARVPMRTKQWSGMQAVVDQVSRMRPCVQIGSTDDPPLANAVDLRGRTTLRETAAVLAQARLFVGLVGFLMHLARAVDCPAVIVYGGRERPEFTGYAGNFNVVHQPPCSPCWQRNRCDFEYACMTGIAADSVIAGVQEMLSRPREMAPATETCLS